MEMILRWTKTGLSHLHTHTLPSGHPAMLRRATVRLLPHRRLFSTSDAPASDDLFAAAWRRVVPNVDLPQTPLAFRQPRPASIPSKLTFNLISRYSSHFSNNQVFIFLHLHLMRCNHILISYQFSSSFFFYV